MYAQILLIGSAPGANAVYGRVEVKALGRFVTYDCMSRKMLLCRFTNES